MSNADKSPIEEEDPQSQREFVLFWKTQHPFSQWHPSKFVGESEYGGGQETFCNAEQWMMYNKALLFDDQQTAGKILATSDARKIKALGREVQHFKEGVWKKHRTAIVVGGTRLKFTQNEDLKAKLLQTGSKIIAEASPHDKVWGIGLGEQHKDATVMARWKGLNLLGEALMTVREELQNELGGDSETTGKE